MYIKWHVQTGQIRMSVLKQLVKLEASKIFIKLVIELQSKSVGSPDALITELIFILGQLSQKGNDKTENNIIPIIITIIIYI